MGVTSAEEFLAVLEKSQLLTSEQLERAKRIAAKKHNPTALAKALARRKIITRWQAGQLLAGRSAFLLGKYKLIKLLGHGGMGRVFLGQHTTMNRRVALKILPRKVAKDPASLQRFLSEARAIATLDHPNIIRAYSVDNEGDRYYLVMEYVHGRDLQELVETEGPPDFETAADYIRQAAEGLAHAHQREMIHCDVKPSNLLVSDQGVLKILDLGLARLTGRQHDDEDSQGDEKRVLGSVDYLAPEQAVEGPDFDHRADIYSLGCTFYFLLTGAAPFPEGTLPQRIVKHQTQQPRSIIEQRLDAPTRLVEICKGMMAKDPKDRFQSIAEVGQVLSDWLPVARKHKRIPPRRGPEKPDKEASAQQRDPRQPKRQKSQRPKKEKSARQQMPVINVDTSGEKNKKRKKKKSPAVAVAQAGTAAAVFKSDTDKTPMIKVGGEEGASKAAVGLGRKQRQRRIATAVLLGLLVLVIAGAVPFLLSGPEGDGDASTASGSGADATAGGRAVPADLADELEGMEDLQQDTGPPEALPFDEPPVEDPSAEAPPPDEPPEEDTPPEDTPPEDTPPEDTPPEDTPAEDTPAEDTPDGEPAGDKPAEQPGSDEPTDKPEDKPVGEPAEKPDPFRDLKRDAELPALAGGEGSPAGSVSFGKLYPGDDGYVGIKLIGGQRAANKGKLQFDLKRMGAKENDTRWLISLEPKGGSGGSTTPSKVAGIWLDEGTLKFRWLKGADPSQCQYLRNCGLSITTGGANHWLPLGRPKRVDALALNLDRGTSRISVPIDCMPDIETIRMKFTTLEGKFAKPEIKPADIIGPKSALNILIPGTNLPDFLLHVTFDVRGRNAKIEVSVLWKAPGFPQPQPFRAADARRILGGAVAMRQSMTQAVAQIQDQAQKKTVQERIDAVSTMLKGMEGLPAFYEANHKNGKVHFRLFANYDNRHVDLVATSPPEQPLKQGEDEDADEGLGLDEQKKFF